MNKCRNFAIGLAVALFASVSAQAADFTVTVEPNYPPAQAQDVYRPLLAYLSKATGHRFILKTSGNYHVYWRDMRGGAATDFAFEEAHFTDYRHNRQRFTPLVWIRNCRKRRLTGLEAISSTVNFSVFSSLNS